MSRAEAKRPGGYRLLRLLETLGRVTMDLGFSGVIEKFQEHFGSRWTRALLMLIGLAIVAGCVSVIWTWLLAPILTFLGSSPQLQTFILGGVATLGIGCGVALGYAFVTGFVTWRRMRRQVADFKVKVREGVDSTVGLVNAAQELLARAKERRATVDALFERLLGMHRRNLEIANIPEEKRAKFFMELEAMEREFKALKKPEDEVENFNERFDALLAAMAPPNGRRRPLDDQASGEAPDACSSSP